MFGNKYAQSPETLKTLAQMIYCEELILWKIDEYHLSSTTLTLPHPLLEITSNIGLLSCSSTHDEELMDLTLF
ncbi:unnamed protein product [Didymodactylos carnosus]|uniref:Uncharacterized protein n=1 Tax=Didymodactylos carnosus TaxID=1234261 RepID=A0A8S2PAI2_9BILA|nr:unnamed protein product [Didymodactylos carnosus]CAF4042472.1 unnamed protein product [Didymodactylos carnosus]